MVPTEADVEAFLDRAEPAGRREDGFVLFDMMNRATGVEPVMWGPSIVGYGQTHYRYESGREGDMPLIGFSPRKANLAVYGMQGPATDHLIEALGPHKLGAGCLWLGRLTKIDLDALERLVVAAWAHQVEISGGTGVSGDAGQVRSSGC